MLFANHQGSIVAYANYSGVKQAIYTYGPWGEPTDEVGNANWTGPRFRYTGQVALPEVRLYYYKARVYDPVMGRFLQTDPIGSKDDLNLYAYVGGDPVNKVDPTGLKKCKTFGKIECPPPASAETRRQQQEFRNQTQPTRAPGTTVMVSATVGGNAGPANLSKSRSLAVDDKGNVAALETTSGGLGNSTGLRAQASVTVTVANGRVEDQTGTAVAAQGGGGVLTGGTSVAQNAKGELVQSVTFGVATPSTPGGSVGVSDTVVVQGKSNPEIDQAAANVPMSCPQPNSCMR